jgi:hypothetical protein
MQPPQSHRQTLFHQAMATTFSVEVAHPEPRYAQQAVAAAFAKFCTF